MTRYRRYTPLGVLSASIREARPTASHIGRHDKDVGTWTAALGKEVSAEVLWIVCQHIIFSELGQRGAYSSGSLARLQPVVVLGFYKVSQAAASGRRPSKKRLAGLRGCRGGHTT